MALAIPCPCCVPPSSVRRRMRSRVPCRRATRSLPRSGFRRVILPESITAQVECQQESTKATRVRLAEDECHLPKVQHELRIRAQQVTAEVAVEIVLLNVRDERLQDDIELLRDDDRIAQCKPHVGEHSHGSLLDSPSPTPLSHEAHGTGVDLRPEPTTARFIYARFRSPQRHFPLWRCRDHDIADPQFASKRRGKCPESVRATGRIPAGPAAY